MMETLQTNYYDQTHGQRGSGCLLNSGLMLTKTITTESLKYDARFAYSVASYFACIDGGCRLEGEECVVSCRINSLVQGSSGWSASPR